MDFDVVPYEDIVWEGTLGAGGFGSVYKGQYLGLDIAVKEIRPSANYNVRKYFEREWRIMRECRHPNIVQFVGLSQEPGRDGRVFIVSEYVPGGNLRTYLRSTAPLPWARRLSFANDIARAVAYLHARQCIHRDLKGENLLLTNDNRIKVADFGFARITARGPDELRHMTYCGTDGYMSPEIITGEDFDLPTDVYSLGIIFMEILTRTLVGSKTYARQAPHFTPDPIKVKQRALEPGERPTMPHVLGRLGAIQPPTGNPSIHDNFAPRHNGKRALPIFGDHAIVTDTSTAPFSNPSDTGAAEAQVEDVPFDVPKDDTIVLQSCGEAPVTPESAAFATGTGIPSGVGYQTAPETSSGTPERSRNTARSDHLDGSASWSVSFLKPSTTPSVFQGSNLHRTQSFVAQDIKPEQYKHHFIERHAKLGRTCEDINQPKLTPVVITLLEMFFARTARDKCLCCSKLPSDVRQCQHCGGRYYAYSDEVRNNRTA